MGHSTKDFEEWARGSAPASGDGSNGHPSPSPLPDLTGMPAAARMRLREHVTNPRAPFNAGLGIGELLLTRACGYEPVAQVIGVSLYKVGSEWMTGSLRDTSRELVCVTEARWSAWRSALAQMTQQAAAAECDLVAGARLDRMRFAAGQKSRSPGYGKVIEVSLSGTAMRARAAVGSGARHAPILTTLAGDDLYSLHTAGCRPRGIAYGCCVYYQVSRWGVIQGGASPVPLGTGRRNQEVADYSKGIRAAQHAAEERMGAMAQAQQAEGVLDVRFTTTLAAVEREVTRFGMSEPQKISGLVVTVECVGTAISDGDRALSYAPRPVLSLSDRPAKRSK